MRGAAPGVSRGGVAAAGAALGSAGAPRPYCLYQRSYASRSVGAQLWVHCCHPLALSLLPRRLTSAREAQEAPELHLRPGAAAPNEG